LFGPTNSESKIEKQERLWQSARWHCTCVIKSNWIK